MVIQSRNSKELSVILTRITLICRLNIGLELFFATAPTASKMQLRSGQQWLESNHLVLLTMVKSKFLQHCKSVNSKVHMYFKLIWCLLILHFVIKNIASSFYSRGGLNLARLGPCPTRWAVIFNSSVSKNRKLPKTARGRKKLPIPVRTRWINSMIFASVKATCE